MSDLLKAVIQDLINDRTEQAQVSIHDYIVAKTQQIAGLSEASEEDEEVTNAINELSDDVLSALKHHDDNPVDHKHFEAYFECWNTGGLFPLYPASYGPEDEDDDDEGREAWYWRHAKTVMGNEDHAMSKKQHELLKKKVAAAK